MRQIYVFFLKNKFYARKNIVSHIVRRFFYVFFQTSRSGRVDMHPVWRSTSGQIKNMIHILYPFSPSAAFFRVQKRNPCKVPFFSVICLGLEPRTPSLKGMCSTCWASRSAVCFRKSGAKVIRAVIKTNSFFRPFSEGLALLLQPSDFTPCFSCACR